MMQERDEELAHLNRVLTECVAGRGGLVVVKGAAGIGKSVLLEALARDAAAAGVLTLRAVASRAENTSALGVMDQIFQHIPTSSEGNHALGRLGSNGPSMTRSETGGEQGSAELTMRGLWGSLVEISKTAPVLVIVDDAHHADPASLRCLGYFARRLAGTRILVVLAELSHPHRISQELDGDLLRHPHSHRVELGGLPRDGVAAMLEDRLTDPPDDEVVTECYALTGGNPFLVRAFAEDYEGRTSEGIRATAETSRNSYARSALVCLHRGPRTGIWAARGLAVLEFGGERTGLHELLGIDRASAAWAVEVLTKTGIVESGRFRDPSIGAAVLADMDAQERAAMHRRAAKLLSDHGGSRTAIARHLVAALYAPTSWVVPLLREAAAQALLEDEAEFAVDCLNLAVRACDDDEERTSATLMLARVGWRLNPSSVARHLTTLTMALREGGLSSGDARTVLIALLWHGRFEEAGEVLTHLRQSGDEADRGGEAELRMTRRWLSGFHLPPAAGELLSGTQETGCDAGGAMFGIGRPMSQANLVEDAEEVLRASRIDDPTWPAVEAALLALVQAGVTDRAATWCDRAIGEARRRRAPTWQALFTAVRAEIALRQGDLPLAEASAEWSLTYLPRRSWGVTIGLPLSSLVWSATAMGKYENAVAWLREPLPDTIYRTRYGLHYLEARGQFQLATSRPYSALRDFLFCGKLINNWPVSVPISSQWQIGAAEAHIRLGDVDRARLMLTEQLNDPGSQSERTRGMCLRLLAGVSAPPRRPAMLREALVLLEASGDRFGSAHALADLTAAYEELGEPAQARRTRQRALTLAGRCRAEPLRRTLLLGTMQGADEVASHALIGTGSSRGRLSDAEHRVASLAATGYTNREIAARLHITVSTVEQHLTRAYRKLKVTGREGLSERLGSRLEQMQATQAQVRRFECGS